MQENFYQKNNVDASRQMQSGMQQPMQQQTNLGQVSPQQMAPQHMPQQAMPRQVNQPQMYQNQQRAPQQVPQQVQPRQVPLQQMASQAMPPQQMQPQHMPQQAMPRQVQPQQQAQQMNQQAPMQQQQVSPQQMVQQRTQQQAVPNQMQPQQMTQPQMQSRQMPPQMCQTQQRGTNQVSPQLQPGQMPQQQMAQPRMQQPNQVPPQQMVQPQQWQQWNPAGQRGQKEQKDVENTIGKTIMGICASVLIFISFIFFAALVFPFFNDIVKMIIMYGFSAVLTLVGGLLLMRDKENKAFIALTGCGIGGIYISTFVSAFSFDVVSDIVLYICLFFWAVLVCVLSRLRSNIFLIIGQIGMNISMIVGFVSCNEEKDANRLLFIVIYNLIAQLIFYISHFRKGYTENLINQIGWSTGLYAVLLGGIVEYAREGMIGGCISIVIVLTALIPIVLSMTVHRVDEKKNASFGVFNSLYLWAIYAICWVRFEDAYEFVFGLMALLLVLFLVVLELRIPQMNHAGKVILQCTLFFMIDVAVLGVEPLEKYMAMAPLAIGCFIYGFCRKNTVYKIAGLVYVVLLLSNPMGYIPMTIWAVLLAVCVVMLCACYKQQYRMWMKAVGYLALLYVLMRNLPFVMDDFVDIGEWKAILVLAIPAVLNIIVSKIPVLYRDLRTGEEEREFRIETGVIQIALIVASHILMVILQDLSATIAMILLGALVTFTNCYSIIKRDETGWMGIYVATKAVLWVFFALIALEAPSILVSVIGLLVALGCIVVGFAAGMQTGRSLKQIRIFGLVMVLICLLKLILIDLPYDSILLRAISFFVSGVLCFAISLVYNMVDKHLMGNAKRG